MKKDKDIGFDISAFLESADQDNRLYAYQWQIENNGCFKIKQDDDSVKVFTPQLVLALLTREIATFDKEQNIDTIINGLDYLNSYVEGFKKGEQYFDAKFQVSADICYGVNAEVYVMDIHDNFFHRQHLAGFEGWGFVKSNFPVTLTHKRVWEFGYFSGIVNKVEEQVKAHPRIFAKFEKCEHGLPTQQTETKTDKLKTQLGKFGFFELPKVKQLSELNRQSLFELISKSDLPYVIAMFHYLDFRKHLKAEYFTTDNKLFKTVADWFEVGERVIKGNFYVLDDVSNENRMRYTAHKHKEKVIKDYERLK